MQNKCKHVMFIKPLKKLFRQHYDLGFKSIEMGREKKGEDPETNFSVYSFLLSYWNG